jgi:hypothetical protein
MVSKNKPKVYFVPIFGGLLNAVLPLRYLCKPVSNAFHDVKQRNFIKIHKGISTLSASYGAICFRAYFQCLKIVKWTIWHRRHRFSLEVVLT